ncbi:MAG: hypothetical protein AAFR76_11070, partial [Planctomycetota bacterium]
IPMQAHFLALQGVSKLLETVQLVRGSLNSSITVAGVVLCMHDHQTTLSQEVVADLTEFFDTARGTDVPWNAARIFEPPIRRNIKLAECPSFGQTIFEYAPEAAGAKDYEALARSVLGITEPTPTPQSEPQQQSPPEPEPPVVNVVPQQQPQPSQPVQHNHHHGHHDTHTYQPYSAQTPPPDNPA